MTLEIAKVSGHSVARGMLMIDAGDFEMQNDRSKVESEQTAYDQWKTAVDIYIAARVGLVSDDLFDMPYRDWYEAGMHPKHAANKAIRNSATF
jgi:predicted metal-dependent hydrolase